MQSLLVIFHVFLSVAALKIQHQDAPMTNPSCADSAASFLKLPAAELFKMNGTMNPAGGFTKMDWASYVHDSKMYESTALSNKSNPHIDNLLCAVVTIPSNPMYRVSDVICHKGHGYQTCIKHVMKDPEYNHTILKTYLQRRAKEAGGIGLLKKVIDSKKWSASLPLSTDLVVHVRAGDRHVKDANTLVQQVKSMAQDVCKGVKRIVVATAHAFEACAPGEPCEDEHERQKYGFTPAKLRSSQNGLRRIFEGLSKLDLDLAVQSHMHIDQDIVFVASAKCLVATTGGFSQSVLAPLVQMGGGKVTGGHGKPRHCKY